MDNAIHSFNNWGQTFIVLCDGWWCYKRYLWSPVMGGEVMTDVMGSGVMSLVIRYGRGAIVMGDLDLSISKWVPSVFNSFD